MPSTGLRLVVRDDNAVGSRMVKRAAGGLLITDVKCLVTHLRAVRRCPVLLVLPVPAPASGGVQSGLGEATTIVFLAIISKSSKMFLDTNMMIESFKNT